MFELGASVACNLNDPLIYRIGQPVEPCSLLFTNNRYQSCGIGAPLLASKLSARPGPVIYDICPILWSYDPSYFTIEPKRILVETKGELTRGYTVPLRGEPNCELCTDLKHQEILDLFMETVSAE